LVVKDYQPFFRNLIAGYHYNGFLDLLGSNSLDKNIEPCDTHDPTLIYLFLVDW